MRGRVLRLSLAVLAAALATALAGINGGCAAQNGPDGGSGQGGTETSEPIKIGAIVSLTGTYAGLGEPELATLEMEVERINEAGGVNGREIELIVEDDATDEAKAVAAASKLIEQDEVVAIIGATGTGQTMAIRGDIDRASIPQVSMAGGTVITSQFDPLVFQTPWSNTIVVPYTLEALKAAGVSRIAVVTDTGGFGKDGLAVLEELAPGAGIKIVSSQTLNPGDADVTAQLTNIKKSDAQALVMWTAGKEAATVVKNAKELGVELPIYGSHGNARQEFIDGAGDAADGFRFAAGKILVPEAYGEGTQAYSVATEFIDRYRETTGQEPNTFAGHAYDALHLIVQAAERVEGDITATSLRDEIEATSGFVGIGGTFTMSATDHNGLGVSDLTMYVVENGAFKLAE